MAAIFPPMLIAGIVMYEKVVVTGLYGIVRHTMYFTTVLFYLSMPLILNSPVSLVIMLAYITP